MGEKIVVGGCVAFVFALLLACSSGVSSSSVLEPDGTRSTVVRCRYGSPWRCMQEVGEHCPSGYTALSSPPPNGNHSPASPALVQEGQTWIIRVRCGASTAVSAAPVAAPSAGASAVCKLAADDVPEYTRHWSSKHPDDRARDTPPSSEEFLATCSALSEAAQLCLTTSYVQKHEDACIAIFDGLPSSVRNRVALLYSTP